MKNKYIPATNFSNPKKWKKFSINSKKNHFKVDKAPNEPFSLIWVSGFGRILSTKKLSPSRSICTRKSTMLESTHPISISVLWVWLLIQWNIKDFSNPYKDKIITTILSFWVILILLFWLNPKQTNTISKWKTESGLFIIGTSRSRRTSFKWKQV